MTESILPKVEPSANGQHVPPKAPDPLVPSACGCRKTSRPTLGVKRAVLTVPVCKPGRSGLFASTPTSRTAWKRSSWSSDAIARSTSSIRRSGDLLGMAGSARGQSSPRSPGRGRRFLWPIRLPDPDGRRRMESSRG